ncbi:MAG: hypothetical protein LBN29_11270 [Mediterranea sp.]|jgi:hypothetical protein|nr:hypothetical protein [Mediterranea sp.]
MRYIAVPPRVARQLGLDALRRATAEGQVILNETDLTGVAGDPRLGERVKNLGGRVLTAAEARKLLKP